MPLPISKIKATLRGRNAVAAAIVFAGASGWTAYHQAYEATVPAPTVHRMVITPAMEIHGAIDKGYVPPAVKLAVDQLIAPWEGLRTTAYLDRLPKIPVWTVCYGDTLGVKAGMKFSVADCKARLMQRVIYDYYLPLVDGVPGFTEAPISVQAAMISGAYNYGVARVKSSTAAKSVAKHQWQKTCLDLTAYNRAGGVVLEGLDRRRKMGDRERLGEAELCFSGLDEKGGK